MHTISEHLSVLLLKGVIVHYFPPVTYTENNNSSFFSHHFLQIFKWIKNTRIYLEIDHYCYFKLILSQLNRNNRFQRLMSSLAVNILFFFLYLQHPLNLTLLLAVVISVFAERIKSIEDQLLKNANIISNK